MVQWLGHGALTAGIPQKSWDQPKKKKKKKDPQRPWRKGHWVTLPRLLVFVVQSLSHVRLLVIPWTVACQAPLSSIIARSLLKFRSIESVMLFNHLILCHPHRLLPSVFPRSKIFSNESTLRKVTKVLKFQQFTEIEAWKEVQFHCSQGNTQ